MKAAALSFLFSLALLTANNAWARDAVLPAGTLVQCTLDEPNFSSATASVGDPVLCYPHGMYSFGQIVFPRGTYIVGHLADDKEPGHFWGKGNLHLEFDRIGLPSADVPLSAKIIAVSGGYRVDKEGKIIGKGHAKRDAVEWMFPPLWPWKIISLPMRGPRPALKGETRLTLRLMDDVLVPDAASYRRFGQLNTPGTAYAHPALYMRQPQKLTLPSAIAGPQYITISWQSQAGAAVPQAPPPISVAPASDDSGWHKFSRSGVSGPAPAAVISASANPATTEDDQPQPTGQMPDKAAVAPQPATSADGAVTVDDLPVSASNPEIVTVPSNNTVVTSTPAPAPATNSTASTDASGSTAAAENSVLPAPAPQTPKPKLTLFAMQAGTVYAVTDYWRDEDRLAYVLANGKEGQVNLSELDWKTTSQLNVERNVKVTLRDGR